jgi:DNA-binding FadR family transcriptional regulator
MAAIGLRRDTLADQIADAVLERILDQGLSPGDLLPAEGKLAAEFSVSRPVIREALGALKGRGVIDVTNGRGAAVAPVRRDPLVHYFAWAVRLDRRFLVELLDVRRGIEVQSARLAAWRRTDEELAEMRELLTRMARHTDDAEAYAPLDTQLHLAIVRATKNGMLGHLVTSIRSALETTIREGLRRHPDATARERVQQSHEQIVAALEQGSVSAAERAMALHFDRAVAKFLEDD